jgi:hypothetical protein
MKLVQKLVNVYDRVYAISDRLGVPSHCDFVYHNRSLNTDVTVTPRPRVSSPPTNSLYKWENSGVEVNADTVYVSGISRTFDSIRVGSICYIDTKPHTIMWLDSDKSVTFNILAKPERSR